MTDKVVHRVLQEHSLLADLSKTLWASLLRPHHFSSCGASAGHIHRFSLPSLPCPFLNSRTNLGPAARAAASRPQTAGEDHPCPDGAKRKAAAHAADLLQRQPETGRSDEGAAGGDDRPEPQGDPGLVPEQTLQRQEEVHPHEAATAAATQ